MSGEQKSTSTAAPVPAQPGGKQAKRQRSEKDRTSAPAPAPAKPGAKETKRGREPRSGAVSHGASLDADAQRRLLADWGVARDSIDQLVRGKGRELTADACFRHRPRRSSAAAPPGSVVNWLLDFGDLRCQ